MTLSSSVLTVNGKQVIAPIEVNLLATYFEKNNISKIIGEAVALKSIGKTGFYYPDKKRAQSLLMKSGHQLPSRLNKIGFNIIIRHISENVNGKIENILKFQPLAVIAHSDLL